MKILEHKSESHSSKCRIIQVHVCSQVKWIPNSFPGNVILGVRMVVVLVAGLCMDAVGRRRSVLAWMGLYFVVSLARSFTPNAESVVFCVTLEGAAAQAATIALILLGTVINDFFMMKIERT